MLIIGCDFHPRYQQIAMAMFFPAYATFIFVARHTTVLKASKEGANDVSRILVIDGTQA
jgi:hypothetical protein